MRVVEVFGPTIQGEGPYAGRACHFLRLGGCDYRCSWCDTPAAVEPELVRQAENLTPDEVAERLGALEPAPILVISGGNPLLHKLDLVLDRLQGRYRVLAVETQGPHYKPWLEHIDSVVVSPKPPSSGEATARNALSFERFMRITEGHPGLVLKLVVFDEPDLDYARDIHFTYPAVPFYLSCGTLADDELADLGARYGWLCEQVARDVFFHDATVLPQLHVVAWGHAVGV